MLVVLCARVDTVPEPLVPPTPIALPPLSQLPQHLLEGSLRGTPASFLFILLSMAGSTLQNLPSSTHSIVAEGRRMHCALHVSEGECLHTTGITKVPGASMVSKLGSCPN